MVIEGPITKIEHEKGTIHNYSTPSEKIALFRNLFVAVKTYIPTDGKVKQGNQGILRHVGTNGHLFVRSLK